eukprot:3288530-Pleurochrysis_carterae.AAC.1
MRGKAYASGCVFQHPPVRVTRGRASARDVHDNIAQSKKRPRRQGLGEEVGEVVCAVHERH